MREPRKKRVRARSRSIGNMVRRGRRRRRQRGGILPFLVPLALAAGKAIAAGAVSGAAGYGVKKGLEAATRKKRVGKILWAQAQANQGLARNMRNRWLKMAGIK